MYFYKNWSFTDTYLNFNLFLINWLAPWSIQYILHSPWVSNQSNNGINLTLYLQSTVNMYSCLRSYIIDFIKHNNKKRKKKNPFCLLVLIPPLSVAFLFILWLSLSFRNLDRKRSVSVIFFYSRQSLRNPFLFIYSHT